MSQFKCLVCGGSECRLRYRQCTDYFLGLGYPVDYAECLGCGLVQQFPVPADVSPFYADYPVHVRRTRLQELARKWLQCEVYYKPEGETSGKVLLDYGCGDGVYLRDVRARYKVVVGYEPGEALAASLSASSGMTVYSDVPGLLADWEGKVDIITAHYVMEHVTDLCATVKLFSRLLKPGGMVHVAVPNIRSWEARLFGRYWHGLDAPRHISFPDAAAFNQLGADHELMLDRQYFAVFPNTLAASVCTRLAGRYIGWLFNALILPSWLIAQLAPSGTEVFILRKA